MFGQTHCGSRTFGICYTCEKTTGEVLIDAQQREIAQPAAATGADIMRSLNPPFHCRHISFHHRLHHNLRISFLRGREAELTKPSSSNQPQPILQGVSSARVPSGTWTCGVGSLYLGPSEWGHKHQPHWVCLQTLLVFFLPLYQ